MTKPEYQRAAAWAERCNLKYGDLAKQIGYAAITTYWFLKGDVPPNRQYKDRKVKPWVWLRFKRACGDLDAEINGRKRGERFDW